MQPNIYHFVKTSRARTALLIITITGFVSGISFYGIIHFENLTIRDLYFPTGPWIGYGLIGMVVTGAIWTTYSTLIAHMTHRPVPNTLYEDAFSYLPALCLIGMWLKHMEYMSSLALVAAFSGIIAWKVWNLSPVTTLWSNKRCLILLTVLVGTYILVFGALSGFRVHAFNGYSDFAVMIQPIWGFGRAQSLFMTALGNSFFGGHFWLTLALLGPLYRLFEHPITLTVIHTTFLGLGAVPVFLLAREHLRAPMVALAFALAYLLYPAIQLPNLADFHETLLVPPLFLFLMYYLDRRSYWLTSLFAFLAIGCKEDMAIPIVLVGIYAFLNTKTRQYGLFLAIFGAAWFLTVVFVVMPTFTHLDPLMYVKSSAFTSGQNPSLINALSVAFAQVFTVAKTSTIPHLLLPLGFLSVLGFRETILWSGPLLVLMLYTGPPFDAVGTIYSWHITAVVPFVFYAAIKGTHRGLGWLKKYDTSTNQARSVVTICMLILVCSIGTNATYGAIPFRYNFNWRPFQVTDHALVGHRLLSRIPDDPDIPVSATPELVPYLSHRKAIYTFPYPFVKSRRYANNSSPLQPVFVMIDSSYVAVQRVQENQREGFLQETRMIILNPEYKVLESEDGFVLLQRIPAGFERKNL